MQAFGGTARSSRIDDLDVMPFGKQKGAPLDQVDTGMLRWWLRKMDEDGLRAEYREAVVAVLTGRGDRPPSRPAPTRPYHETASARLILGAEIRAVVKAWFARLSFKYHPDKGGSDVQEAVVIEAYKTFLVELEKWEKGQ
jgi:hypothetical protein